MSEIKRRTEKIAFDQAQKVEDVERISNILNRRNPYLRAMRVKGGFSLVEIFPEYKDRKKRKERR